MRLFPILAVLCGLSVPSLAQQSEQAEIKRLQKELKRVTEERDILKKAAAYFANHPE